MGVLQHADRGRLRTQCLEHRAGEGERVLSVRLRRLGTDELAPRRQRYGNRERLAGADQEGVVVPDALPQRPHQRGLADTGLAGDEDELATPLACRLDDGLQRRELFAALQQRIHAAILVAAHRSHDDREWPSC